MLKQIYDPLRKKEVALTPEEEIRQVVIKWLNIQAEVPLGLMASEYSMKYNGLNYRADILVFDKQAKPLLLVECKAPTVKITKLTIEQGIRYNRVLNVKYIMFTNGITTYICKLNKMELKYEFIEKVPLYKQMLENEG